MPIIIAPVITTHVRNCIVEGGVRYCEDANLKSKDLGFVMLGFVCLGLWCGLWMTISNKYFNDSVGVVLGGAMGIPLLIGALCLIFS